MKAKGDRVLFTGASRGLLALALSACGSPHALHGAAGAGAPSDIVAGAGGAPRAGQAGAGGAGATGGSSTTGGSVGVAGGGTAGAVIGAAGSTSGALAAGGVGGDARGGSAGVTGGAPSESGGAPDGIAGGPSGASGVSGRGGGEAGAPGSSGMGGGTSTTESTIVPTASWACGMPDGIAAPTSGELVFQATLQVSGTHDAGITQYGHRRILDVSGGTAAGSKLQATFQKGGFDFELTLSNGDVELEQIDVLKASDGTLILLRTCGVAPAGASEARIVPDFEVASSSALAWLNTGKFVGTRAVNAGAGTIELSVYDVSKVTPGEPKVRLVDPGDRPSQPWECSTETGGKGATVFTENVTLGSSLSIGASKRGTRNIIPITGGSVSGKVAGSVLYGGGDYQLVGGTTRLDARYVVSSGSDFVIVRNCGPIGALVPLFETRADGPYAFLNENKYVSSDPGSGSGGVTITFYERE